MVVKWSNMDRNIGLNDSNLIDDYIKMSKNVNQHLNQPKLHYLNGYLYESPTHKGVACWRALDDFHKLENIKHLLAAVDFETDFKSTYQPNHTEPFALNFENRLFPKPKSNINYFNNYLSKSQKTTTSIYEGCYNAHDLQTSLAIQKTLNNIHDTLSKSYERQIQQPIKKKTIPSKSIHETRLLNEYEKLKSNIESSSQTISSKRTSTKSPNDFDEMKSEKSLKKLEQESLNKIEDDLKSNCENDFDDESSISSSSSRVFYQKTTSVQAKKNFPPKRNRHRVMSHLDKELSSSDVEANKKANSKARQSAFKPIADRPSLESKPIEKTTIDKTDEELISDFEKLSPIDFNKLNNNDKIKLEELYNDLKSNKSNDNASNEIDSTSLKTSQRESRTKIKSSNEKVEQPTTKTNIQRLTSPEKVTDHLIEIYQAAGNKKPIAPKAPQASQATQRPLGPTKPQYDQFNSGKNQRPIYYAIEKNNDKINNSKNNRNPSIKEIFARVKQKMRTR